MTDCFICQKHTDPTTVPGGFLLADEHCVVTHLAPGVPAGSPDRVYLGYLFVEPRRHLAGIGDLTEAEAASWGRLAALASAALKRATGADHIYAAVIGHGVDHLHLHLIARHPGTPREYWWTRVDDWPDAPTGAGPEVAALAERFRAALAL